MFKYFKKGYLSCEIVSHIKEIDTLIYIQTILGGSVSKKTENSCRWRLHNNEGISNLVNSINGKLLSTDKKENLKIFCEKLKIPYIEEKFSLLTNPWFTGFFDADGSINYNTNNNNIVFTASQKKEEVLRKIFLEFGGKIYFEKSWEGYSIHFSNQFELSSLFTYFNKYPLLNKLNDYNTILKLYDFRDLGYHLPNSPNHALFLEVLSKIKNRK